MTPKRSSSRSSGPTNNNIKFNIVAIKVFRMTIVCTIHGGSYLFDLNSLNTKLALNNLNVSHVNWSQEMPFHRPSQLGYVGISCWALASKYFGLKYCSNKKVSWFTRCSSWQRCNKVKHYPRILTIGNIRVICIEQHVCSCASTFYWSRFDELHSICQSINIEWGNRVCLHKMHPNNASQHFIQCCVPVFVLLQRFSFFIVFYETKHTKLRHRAAGSNKHWQIQLDSLSQAFNNISFSYLISLWNRYFFVRNNQI